MSNIHGLGSAADRERNTNNMGQGNFQGNNGQIPNFLNGFMTAQNDRPEPRKETFFQMLHYTFCPGLTMKYFISLITVAQIITFFITFIGTLVSGNNLSQTKFLGPYPGVYWLFNKQPYEIQHGQIWRLLTPIMLHVGFLHLLFNMLSQIIFGSLLEQMIGFRYMMQVYLISG